MSIKVKYKDWQNKALREATLCMAELLGEEIEVKMPKVKFKPFNAQIWKSDDIILEKDFSTKREALKWIKKVLCMKKCSGAYADLKKYNKKDDDFDWWFYKLENHKVIELDALEGIL